MLQEFVEKLKSKNAAGLLMLSKAMVSDRHVPRESIVAACTFMKSEQGFDLLADLCGGDRGPEEDPRFEVNYHLFSTKHHNRSASSVAE
jgi:NADH:ubiquinone oxidoreductase subunit C